MHSQNYIGGEWSIPTDGELIVHNPSNVKEQVGIVHLSGASEVLHAEQAARSALPGWAGLSPAKRGDTLGRLATALEANVETLATIASREMGKPISEMKGEVMRGVNLLKYYAAEGVRSHGSVIPASEAGVLQYTKRVPLGVVGIITPWNFPVAIPIWKIAPALLCGNTVVWKPAEFACLTATKMIEIFVDAGLPAGIINLVIGKGSKIGDVLLEHCNLNAISFTGSTSTGQRIAAICARRNIKYQTEMGGKNAAVVLKDADLDLAIPAILSGAFRSAGQKCTATSRIIVEREIMPSFTAALQKGMEALIMAPALDAKAYLGPVASSSQYDSVMSYVTMAREQAQVVAECKSDVADGEGYFIHPLVVSGVSSDHPLVQEEIFGPVAVVLEADNYEHAVALCNATIFGLSASVFTQDLNQGLRFLDDAEVGMVRVNQETAGVEYQAPFGGTKWSSSHTREQGQAALDFYSEVKTCAIKYS
ncbi:aldehyde dehydrogenase family protein [Paenibacillus sp. N1-5-1-14]|uniref:aldehyde dehydrogenase family protein n=1 Tax=Paenibacillus radicibacter TaxID=2972488 RepID=UPI00215960A4|nr:aldehyde dehydrogenase family protein [Paenibacillus radicibacter]MCR8644790.1 aldehyde dehydrogenase family protein [Paenibacillus radicibacter]